jgi:hypothetical protein
VSNHKGAVASGVTVLENASTLPGSDRRQRAERPRKPLDDSEFTSILGPAGTGVPWREIRDEPACFGDLHLDNVVAAATGGKEEYELEPIFHAPCRDPDTIVYRQQVFADLRLPGVLDCLNTFSEHMHMIRVNVAYADNVKYSYNKKLWLFDAIDTYCEGCSTPLIHIARPSLL